LPSDRARVWRFTYGYLKKTGEPSNVVDRAESVAETKQGVIGISVAVLAPNVQMHDRITINEELINKIKNNAIIEEQVEEVKKTKRSKK
jgi:ribosomal protein S3